jgi:drug/metabolite transporter (DMT)-like permease
LGRIVKTVRPSIVSVVLLIAVMGISLSGPLVRSSGAHPIAIAIWRLVFSLAIIAIPLVVGGSWRQWRQLDRNRVVAALTGGAMLAAHFWSWNTSIGLTTIASSVVLVNVQPLIVGVLSAVWLREAPSRGQWIGIGVAVAGSAVVVWPDLAAAVGGSLGARAALGDLLALVGAVTAAIYYVIGRRLRSSLDLWPYVALVYGTCLVVLLVLAFAMGVRVAPQPAREFGVFAALALGPMLLGHTGLNWALRYARAYQVNIVLLGEPVCATLLAALLPGIREQPTAFTLVGGAVVLTGILLAERPRKA